MTVEPRAALDRLVAALEAHHNAVASRRGDEDPAVDDAYDVLGDAFEVYDEALLETFGEVLPMAVVEDDDDEEEDDDDDDDDENDGEDDHDDLDDEVFEHR
jgi:hypothetical protein